MSPRRTPLREDSACKLLENSCDQDLLISDLDDEDLDDDEELEDEEIELLVEEGQAPILINRKQILKNNSNVSSLAMINPHHHTAGQKIQKSPGKKTNEIKYIKNILREVAFLAVLNFFPAQKLIFG